MNHILLSIKQIMNKIFLEGDDPPPHQLIDQLSEYPIK